MSQILRRWCGAGLRGFEGKILECTLSDDEAPRADQAYQCHLALCILIRFTHSYWSWVTSYQTAFFLPDVFDLFIRSEKLRREEIHYRAWLSPWPGYQAMPKYIYCYKYTLSNSLKSSQSWPAQWATMSTKLFILIAALAAATVANADFHRCQCCDDDPPPRCSR